MEKEGEWAEVRERWTGWYLYWLCVYVDIYVYIDIYKYIFIDK